MYIKKSRMANGREKLSFVVGYRKNGKVKHKYIDHIGYLDELKKTYDNPLEHFQEIAKQRSLEAKSEPVSIVTNGTLPLGSQRKNLGYAILQKIYRELEVDRFLNKKQRRENVEYRFNDILRLLTYSRILNPGSIKATHENKSIYFEKFDFSLKDSYRCLDRLLAFKDELLEHLYQVLSKKIGLDTTHAYYDCTNYYFEIDYNDEDEVNEAGELIKPGLRKKGVSKENSTHPIVGMGLLLDNQGIPISYDVFPGNQSEKVTLRPILNKAKSAYQLDKVVVIADKGLNTSDNIFFNNTDFDGYIYSKSIRGADSEFISWALSDDLTNPKNNKKSRIKSFDISLQRNGKRNTKVTVIQKQVVYYSEKYADRSRYQRTLTIEKAKALIANPGKYTQATSVGAAGYIKNIDYDKKTGEIITKDLSLNIDKIKEEAKYDGYNSIVTSEIEMSDDEIVEKYKCLWKIEESFRITKSEFKTRPIYLSTEDHIKAHFLICYLALVIIRLLEKSLHNEYSPAQIIKTLNNYSCSYLDQNFYLFDFRNQIIQDLENTYQIDFSRQILKLSEIKKILSK